MRNLWALSFPVVFSFPCRSSLLRNVHHFQSLFMIGILVVMSWYTRRWRASEKLKFEYLDCCEGFDSAIMSVGRGSAECAVGILWLEDDSSAYLGLWWGGMIFGVQTPAVVLPRCVQIFQKVLWALSWFLLHEKFTW